MFAWTVFKQTGGNIMNILMTQWQT